MTVVVKPAFRAIGIGVIAAALLIGAFLLGSARTPAANASGNAAQAGQGNPGGLVLTAAQGGGKITVTGTGTVTGTPDQLILSMGVQTSASSVSIALRQANEAASRVIHSLKAGGVRAADIQTSGLSIQPNYTNGSQVPVGYGVSEQLTATLRNLSKAGSQIQSGRDSGRERHHRERCLAEPGRHQQPARPRPDGRCPRRPGKGRPVRARPRHGRLAA